MPSIPQTIITFLQTQFTLGAMALSPQSRLAVWVTLSVFGIQPNRQLRRRVTTNTRVHSTRALIRLLAIDSRRIPVEISRALGTLARQALVAACFVAEHDMRCDEIDMLIPPKKWRDLAFGLHRYRSRSDCLSIFHGSVPHYYQGEWEALSRMLDIIQQKRLPEKRLVHVKTGQGISESAAHEQLVERLRRDSEATKGVDRIKAINDLEELEHKVRRSDLQNVMM